jgi:dCMP deaminase
MKVIDNWNEYYLRLAYLVARKSKDESSKIGSVLVKNNSVISSGYNGICAKVLDPWDYENKLEKFSEDIREKGYDFYENEKAYEKIKNRKLRPYKYMWVSHSENNCICQVAKMGISSNGSTLYTLAIPCDRCAVSLIQAGVSEVIVHKQFNDIFYQSEKWNPILQVTIDMFEEAGVKLKILDLSLDEIVLLVRKNINYENV